MITESVLLGHRPGPTDTERINYNEAHNSVKPLRA